ncbi:hypothetical protein FKP32DRAFT_1270056 [Trametes sanguinea]|nr:hypothetical protein FKP32DRAFT_1270056 [Trametes sanguinea]
MAQVPDWELTRDTPCFALYALAPAYLKYFTMRCYHHAETRARVNLQDSWTTAMSLTARCADFTCLHFGTWKHLYCSPLAFTGLLPSTLKKLSVILYGDHALLLVWNLDSFPSLEVVTLITQGVVEHACIIRELSSYCEETQVVDDWHIQSHSTPFRNDLAHLTLTVPRNASLASPSLRRSRRYKKLSSYCETAGTLEPEALCSRSRRCG